ncbi:MAG: 1-(5-phosphoribosyl)-5-[(5-phosphoribosylamino)methylideneamino]imidazole-4-carboxamide isomerase [Thermoleophilia bacterium]|nr:1-(5-phosphoribosyl)-5-[(5-phosphoribosylamino)methylideneamino]imidazole-4-carboxamide isomerase [Thermoleophilia bacterium]
MRLIPAIDIQKGRCVRLRQGDFADETVFSEDPVAMARHWVREGARYLHVVDLDGAREGRLCNFALVSAIAEAVPVPVQTGGGIRDEAAVQAIAESKVAKAVLGTAAVENESLLEFALGVLGPDRVVVAVDAEGGWVKVKGWQEKSAVRAVDLVHRLEELGVREVLYTDIARDGMLQSANVAGVRELAEACQLEIIASGGVTGLDDLRALKELEPLGVTGVIVGRALYEGRFTIAEALAVLGEEGNSAS